MLNISEDKETIQQFNDMYNKIINDNSYSYDKNIDITCIKENEYEDYK